MKVVIFFCELQFYFYSDIFAFNPSSCMHVQQWTNLKTNIVCSFNDETFNDREKIILCKKIFFSDHALQPFKFLENKYT